MNNPRFYLFGTPHVQIEQQMVVLPSHTAPLIAYLGCVVGPQRAISRWQLA